MNNWRVHGNPGTDIHEQYGVSGGGLEYIVIGEIRASPISDRADIGAPGRYWPNPGFNTDSTLSACSCECCERAAITPTQVGVWHRTEEAAWSERRLQLPTSCTHALWHLAPLT